MVTVMVTNKIIEVEGIGAHYAKILDGVDIKTTNDLLKACRTPKDRETLSKKTGISGKLILEWANRCDLFRIKGIGEEYSDLLEAVGVDTVVELSKRDPARLHEALKAKAEATGTRIVRRAPSQNNVAAWVKEAKKLPRMLEY